MLLLALVQLLELGLAHGLAQHDQSLRDKPAQVRNPLLQSYVVCGDEVLVQDHHGSQPEVVHVHCLKWSYLSVHHEGEGENEGEEEDSHRPFQDHHNSSSEVVHTLHEERKSRSSCRRNLRNSWCN